MPTIEKDPLERFAASLLVKGGATEQEAACVARSLVASDLRGYASHGVMRIPFYIDMLAGGTIVSGAPVTVLVQSPVHVVADGNWGFGRVQAGWLLDQLLERLAHSAIAVGTLMHSGHIGRLGEYCELAAQHNYVSMMMVNSHGAAVRVAPPGGKAARLSTNPLAIGVCHRDEPLILDFSTSATAEGKVRVKKIAGQPVPDGWLIDHQGRPTNDPNVLYSDPPGAIVPMGGPQAYKGFGLGLMIEILTGALSGGVTAGPVVYPQKGNCVFLLLLDPAQFGGADHFASELNQLVDYTRSCPRVDGVDRILLPGDPERETLAWRRKQGIPLDQQNWQSLVKLAERLDVPVPAVRTDQES